MNEEDRDEVASNDTGVANIPDTTDDNEVVHVDDRVDDQPQETSSGEMPQPMPLDEPNQPATENTNNSNEQPMPMQESTEPVSAAAIGGRSDTSKLRLLWVAIAVIVLIAGAVAAWFLVLAPTDNANDTEQTVVEIPKLGVAPTVIDGTVEYKSADSDWQALSSETELVEGDMVRTAKESRTVLTIDDGSAVRLDSDTAVELVSLAADNVKITQLAGSVYSRVVASDRAYSITIDEASYEAMGTAFVTSKSDQVNGVQVFQSSVKASGIDEVVSEGKQYYVANSNSALHGKITGIELAKLVSNKFIAWNVAEDKKDEKFKDKLGALSKYDQVVKEEAAKRKAEAERKKAEEAARQAAAEQARLEAERRAREAASTAMTVEESDGGILWTYNGEAEHGFKVLYSLTNASPLFKQDGTKAVYVDEPHARFNHIHEVLSKGKTYYVRVCAYYPNASNGPCLDYSNTLTIRGR